ncbi:MAG: hypothetical protein WD492_03375 [Alkalispirochaeta sp.]
MNRTIALVLIVVLLAPAGIFAQAADSAGDGQQDTTQRSNSQSYNQGVMDAEDNHSAIGWGVGGFVAGGLFSWLGTGVTVLIANGSRPTPQYVPDDVEPVSYRSGYRDEASRKNRRSAAIPGVIMSTLWTVLVLSAAQ